MAESYLIDPPRVLSRKQRRLFTLHATTLVFGFHFNLFFWFWSLPFTVPALVFSVAGMSGAPWIANRPVLQAFTHVIGGLWLAAVLFFVTHFIFL